FQKGSFNACTLHGVAPLPVLIEYGPAIWPGGDKVSDYIWAGTNSDPASVNVARLTTAYMVGLPLLGLVVGWVYCRTGSALAAGGAAMLLALSPNVIAHSNLATTDACFALTFVAAAAALGRCAEAPTAGRFALAGVLVGLAIA